MRKTQALVSCSLPRISSRRSPRVGRTQDNKDMKLRGVLLTNRAAVNLLLRNYGRVRADCAEAVKLDEKNVG